MAGQRVWIANNLSVYSQLGAHLSERLGLGLGLGVEGDKLRFYVGGASLPESAELIAQLDAKMSAAEAQAEEEARNASPSQYPSTCPRVAATFYLPPLPPL